MGSRASGLTDVAAGYSALLADERSRAAATRGIEFLGELFADPDSIGSEMAGRAEATVGEPETVAASASVLVATCCRSCPPTTSLPDVDGAHHETRLLIGGELVAGAGTPIAVENPYTTETIVEVAAASPEQVEATVAAARAAWPGWAHTTAGER